MLETLMTSKIRVILIKHFLGHRGERFYLRQLERLLQLPLTPARRELIRLEKMGLLKQEQEANLKFYKVNEGFERLEELEKFMGIPEKESGKWKMENVKEIDILKSEPILHSLFSILRINWLAPVFGVIALLMTLQVGLFYIWTHPVVGMGDSRQRTATVTHSKDNGKWIIENGNSEKEKSVTLATDSYVMSSGKTRLESGGFGGGWQ